MSQTPRLTRAKEPCFYDMLQIRVTSEVVASVVAGWHPERTYVLWLTAIRDNPESVRIYSSCTVHTGHISMRRRSLAWHFRRYTAATGMHRWAQGIILWGAVWKYNWLHACRQVLFSTDGQLRRQLCVPWEHLCSLHIGYVIFDIRSSLATLLYIYMLSS